MKKIVLDLETSSLDIETNQIRLWGVLDLDTNEIVTGVFLHDLRKIVSSAEFITGYNIKGFDLPILKRFGIVPNFKTIILDLHEVLAPRPLSEKDPPGKGRAAIIGELRIDGIIDNRFPNLKLDTVIRHLSKVFKDRYKFENLKGTYDYKKLAGILTTKDYKELDDYLKSDLLAERDLFLFLDDYFKGLKDYLSDTDIQKYAHISASTASIGYKAICKYLNLEEKYGDKIDEVRPGAFVIPPAGEKFSGRGLCKDFNSQHPHHIWNANLFTPATAKEISEGNYWQGDGKIFKLDGKYSTKRHGKIEKLIRSLYFKRLYYQRKFICENGKQVKFKDATIGLKVLDISNPSLDLYTKILSDVDVNEAKLLASKGVDPREYTVKILINAIYGISYSPVFASIYCETTGRDTINMSVQSSKFMKEWFEKHGYNVVYGDTDSLYLFDPFEDTARLDSITSEGINKIRAVLPFSDTTYNMGTDAEFTDIFFFKNPDFDPAAKKGNASQEYLKKTYMYITPEGKLKIKGGKLIKNDATLLGKEVFKKYIYPKILETKNVKFTKDFIRMAIETELRNDISLASRVINCKPVNFYKVTSSLQAQLSLKYGEGTHSVVKNRIKGVGADKDKHCLVSEAKDIPLSSIIIDKTWSELNQFIKEETKQEALKNWF